MATLHLDTKKTVLVATGKVRPEPVYTQNADGSNTKVKGAQAKTEAGVEIWQVDVLLDDDEDQRAEAVSVKVACPVEPQVPKFQPVSFNGLVAKPRVDWRNGNKLVIGMFAESIDLPAAPSGRSAKSTPAE